VADLDVDVVVIGTGPGGEGAAMQAAKHGKKVAVIERAYIGGNCTHTATIPSKALRHAISEMVQIRNNPLFRSRATSLDFTVRDLRRATHSVINQQMLMRTVFYERNDCEVFRGQGTFVGPNEIAVIEDDGGRKTIGANFFVIASGSRPYRPPFVDFHHPRMFDSDTILKIDRDIKTLTIYGAGVIGCEYASMFRNMGVRVNLINTREKLLDYLDEEIIDALSYQFRERGVVIRNQEEVDKVEGMDDGVVLTLKSGKRFKSDALLWAQGRTGNSDNMGLPEVGVTPDSRGNIKVNEFLQTSVSHIYAVGDVIGQPALASAAYMQGRCAAMHLLGDKDLHAIKDIPTGIYTSPEISSLGKTERELTLAKTPYEVGYSHFKNLARAQISNQTAGMLKILFHYDTLEILGIHCFGANSSEIIHIGQAIMMQPPPNNTIRYFINTTFNYPTMAEAYRVAALNGLNRLF
jgi:NAD(P) transhydrogenase